VVRCALGRGAAASAEAAGLKAGEDGRAEGGRRLGTRIGPRKGGDGRGLEKPGNTYGWPGTFWSGLTLLISVPELRTDHNR
jgi:hypothetical protein